MDLKELYKAYTAKIDAAKALSAQWKGKEAEIPLEVTQKISGFLGESDEIKVRIDLAERIAAGEKFSSEPQGTKAAHLGWREAGPDEGNAPVDVKDFREFSVKFATPLGIMEKTYRYFVPLVVAKKGYTPAFEAYLRKGLADMGPNDRKALAEATDAAGGYLVPEDMQGGILKKIATLATVRQYARIISTSRDIVKLVRRKYTTDNKYTSGIRLTWTGESPATASVHRVTDQVYGEFAIPVGTAMASQLISADLLEDNAYDVMGDSEMGFAEAFALGENAAFWSGSGAIQPRGILTDASDTANFDTQITTGADVDTIDADEVIDVCYALPAQYERNARWFMTKATEKYIRKLKTSTSDYLWPVVSNVGSLGGAPTDLLDFPRTKDEFMDNISDATNTTTYPLVFGDLYGYTVVDRVGLSLKRDENLYAELNQVLLLGRKRVGGQLTEGYRLSLMKTVHTT